MTRVGRLLALAAVSVFSAGGALAQTTVKWLHIEVNPNQVKIWEEVARDFEAKNPGAKVEMSFLENEAYKAKAPTLLQSKDKPHIIYSWAGGVLKSQVEAGVLEDITAQVADHKGKLSRRRSRGLHCQRKNLRLAAYGVAGRLHVQQGTLRQGRC